MSSSDCLTARRLTSDVCERCLCSIPPRLVFRHDTCAQLGSTLEFKRIHKIVIHWMLFDHHVFFVNFVATYHPPRSPVCPQASEFPPSDDVRLVCRRLPRSCVITTRRSAQVSVGPAASAVEITGSCWSAADKQLAELLTLEFAAVREQCLDNQRTIVSTFAKCAQQTHFVPKSMNKT